MNSKRIFLLALFVATTLLAQVGCSSQSTTPQNVATASPTPAMDGAASPAAGDAGTMTSSNTASGATSLPPGSSANPGMTSANTGASNINAPSSGSSAAAPPPPPPRVFTLTAGTPISVWTSSTISTKTAKSGDSFTGTLAQPIVDGDWVVAKKGATVSGVVVNADEGGRVKGVASLTLQLTRLTLADGRTVDLDTSKITRQAKTTKKKDAVKVGVGAGIGAVTGAILGGKKGAAIGAGAGAGAGTGVVLATKGDPAVIGSESQLTFRTTSPVKITKQ
ncbi:MAG: hypothetical protein JNK38_03485 [Acidobacteria bacterium]|nr:hypothetical protein [Acidobacteriota bacterium]